LMDIDMPVMNGVEATQTLRAKGGKYTDLPILALTAHVLPEDRAELLEAGLTDILHKPVDREKLVALVGAHLGPQPATSQEEDTAPEDHPVEEKIAQASS
ncbi:MAG: response regulator, partial [Pseudomonadota bacterium]